MVVFLGNLSCRLGPGLLMVPLNHFPYFPYEGLVHPFLTLNICAAKKSLSLANWQN